MVGEDMILSFYCDCWVQISICLEFFFCLYFLFGTSDFLFFSLRVLLVCCWCRVWEIFLDFLRCESVPCCKLFNFLMPSGVFVEVD